MSDASALPDDPLPRPSRQQLVVPPRQSAWPVALGAVGSAVAGFGLSGNPEALITEADFTKVGTVGIDADGEGGLDVGQVAGGTGQVPLSFVDGGNDAFNEALKSFAACSTLPSLLCLFLAVLCALPLCIA